MSYQITMSPKALHQTRLAIAQEIKTVISNMLYERRRRTHVLTGLAEAYDHTNRVTWVNDPK